MGFVDRLWTRTTSLSNQAGGITISQVNRNKQMLSLGPVTRLMLNKHFPFVIVSELGSCLWYLNTSHFLSLGRTSEMEALTEKEFGSVGVAKLLKQPSKERNLPGATR